MKRIFTFLFPILVSTGMYGDELKSDVVMTLSEKMKELRKEESSAEKNPSFHGIYRGLVEKKELLKKAYDQALQLISDLERDPTQEEPLKKSLKTTAIEIEELKRAVRLLEEEWKQAYSEKQLDQDQKEGEIDGIWHQPDTTIGQLIIDYNTSATVYIVPPEIAALKIHLSSQIPIPKSSWNEILELILTQMGVGIKQIIPFVKQLYIIKANQSGLQTFTDDRALLDTLSDDAKIAFVLSPPPGEMRRSAQFIDRFSPQEQLSVQIVGSQLIVTGVVREVREILKIYDFITSPKRAQEYKIISLEKTDSEEVTKILISMFDGDIQRNGMDLPQFGAEKSALFSSTHFSADLSGGFRIIPLKCPSPSIFIMGKIEQIEKAHRIIQDIEASIGDLQNRTIHWYACQHSEAEELAKVLYQVYMKLASSQETDRDGKKRWENSPIAPSTTEKGVRTRADSNGQESRKSLRSNSQDALIVSSPMISTPTTKRRTEGPSLEQIQDNFIVDPKTNSIIMVVENGHLPKLQELVKKLDVPKRMVQIDLLLFEKRVSDSSSFGLNLLQTGAKASKKHTSSIAWNEGSAGSSSSDSRGILQFALSRGKGGFLPAYELAYQFLLSQEDIQINANPSIVTVNQTPATIAVVDQISINTGAVEYNRDHVKDSYARVEYGITIQITPTVHSKIDQESELDEQKFVTLATEICFDTTHPNKTERPEVTRRNIKNEVRIRDGETIILGGLRKKHTTGSQQSIPFLGDIPGIGKLFSTTALTDLSTEMFIFITPRIVPDNRESAKKIRYEQLISRPGDIPEFLDIVQKAKTNEKEMLFERSLKLLFESNR